MSIIKTSIVNLLAATSAFAAVPQFEVEARYEGFGPSLIPVAHSNSKYSSRDGVVSLPRVTAKAGQTATVELLVEEVVLPVTLDGKAPKAPRGPVTFRMSNAYGETAVDGRKPADAGFSLEITPEIKDGQIILSGKSTIRRLQQPGAVQPLKAVSLATRETYFSDVVTDGQTVTIKVGDWPSDKAQITLKIKLIDPDAVPGA